MPGIAALDACCISFILSSQKDECTFCFVEALILYGIVPDMQKWGYKGLGREWIENV